MSKWKLRMVQILAAGCILGLTACNGKEVLLETSQEVYETTSEMEETEESRENFIWVYVCGQVAAPGVYKLESDERWFRALELAGGALSEADLGRVNLAQTLTDGEKVYIPAVGEKADMPAEQTGEDSDGRVDINRADVKTLMTLPGIGEAKAADIIAYREREGPFEKIEDLMKVPGIKEGVYGKIQDRIRID